jgi:hypothetical protein
LRATVEAQIAGIQAGADPAAYASVFADIRQTRDSLKERLAALEQPATTEATPDPEAEVRELLSRLGSLAVELLTTQELTVAERQGLLVRLIRAIVPDTWDGQEALRLEIMGAETVTVVCVSSV